MSGHQLQVFRIKFLAFYGNDRIPLNRILQKNILRSTRTTGETRPKRPPGADSGMARGAAEATFVESTNFVPSLMENRELTGSQLNEGGVAIRSTSC